MNPSEDRGIWGCIGAVLAAIIGGIFLLISTDKVSIPILNQAPTPTAALSSNSSPSTESIDVTPQAEPIKLTIKSFAVKHNAVVERRRGMNVSVDFVVDHAKDVPTELCLSLFFSNNSPVRAVNKAFQTSDGDFIKCRKLTHIYDSSNFADFVFFIPYGELQVPTGASTLYFVVSLYETARKEHISVQSQELFVFDTDDHPASFFESITIDYNTVNDNRSGLLVHTDLTAENLKGRKIQLCAFVFDSNHSHIKGKSDNYQSATGAFVVCKNLTLNYSVTTFDNLELFLPTEEFVLAAGNNALYLKIYLLDVENQTYLLQSNQRSFQVNR